MRALSDTSYSVSAAFQQERSRAHLNRNLLISHFLAFLFFGGNQVHIIENTLCGNTLKNWVRHYIIPQNPSKSGKSAFYQRVTSKKSKVP